MAVNKVNYGNTTIIDITDTTAVASDVAQGKYFYNAAGVKTEGTASGSSAITVIETPDSSGGTVKNIIAVDISNDTVDAAHLVSGYTAHDRYGNAVSGSIASKSSSDLTVSGDTVTAPAGYYASSASKSVASGTAGTPTATKGTVSNHSVSVTPSVTNTTGYITGSTKTGTAVTVSASELVSGTKSITANGTGIDVTDYASVDVNVSGGGSSSWTKVAETSYQVSTTSTSTTTVATWATGHSELWTSDKWVYIRIRDTAGKRNGYFYGTDSFIANLYPVNSASSTTNSGCIYTFSVYSNGQYISRFNSSSIYGVYPSNTYPNGNIEISTRYSSNYSRTINGTYSVEVYLLDPPTGAPIFT